MLNNDKEILFLTNTILIRSYFTSNSNFYVHHINLTRLSQYEFNDLLCVPAHMELTGLVTTMHSAHNLHNSNVLTWDGKSNSTKLALWLKYRLTNIS
jgi:hypothetical protein